MNRSRLAMLLVAAAGVGCSDQPLPVGPGAPRAQITSTATPCSKTLADAIRSQINTLFPKTRSLRQAASSQFDNIVRLCPSADAQANAVDFAQFTMDKFRNRQLTSGATASTVAHLLSDVMAYVGLNTTIPASALESQGAVAEIVPSTSTQVVATGDGKAGASFPPGAVSQPVLVTIAPSADQTDPLPTGLKQFPPFYDFTAYPAVTFGQSVTIGICVNFGSVSQEVVDRLQLARPNPATGGATIELLPRTPAPFLGCPALPGLAAARNAAPADGAGFAARLFAAAASVVSPRVLHAESLRLIQFEGIGGLGGTVKNFGDNPNGTVDPLCGSLSGIFQAYCSELEALYDATDGPSWTTRTNWLETSDFCTWYGVSCFGGIPYYLLLGSNNLTGVLPADLGNLDSLRLLQLYKNHLSGSLPASIGNIHFLQELDAQQNQLSGAIPAELGSLSQLNTLDLRSNQFSGGIPGALGNLSSLAVLELEDNQLSGAIPVALANLGSLQALYLRQNQLSGVLPLSMAQFGESINVCDMSGNAGLSLGDSPDYRAADVNGDGYVCALPLVPLVFANISAGFEHGCGVTTTGGAYCWGNNPGGQLGNGTTKSRLTPGPVTMPSGVTFASVTSGASFACGLTGSGAAYCWGYNFYGQLGDGRTTDRSTPGPVTMPAGVTFVSVSAFGSSACGLTAAGMAYCWGYNIDGQLGDGTTTNQSTPVAVSLPPGVTFARIAAGEVHTCGLTASGAAYCWGDNSLGQLGDGTTTNQSTPVAVTGGNTFASLAAGGSHTCGLTSAGEVYCWGWNISGQLGIGTTDNQSAPAAAAMPSGVTFTSLSAGGRHTCALTATGVQYCWGYNFYGQLADLTTTDKLMPSTLDPPFGFRFASLSSSIYQSCALTSDGSAYCWGDNFAGQLGDGTTINRSFPVAVK